MDSCFILGTMVCTQI